MEVALDGLDLSERQVRLPGDSRNGDFSRDLALRGRRKGVGGEGGWAQERLLLGDGLCDSLGNGDEAEEREACCWKAVLARGEDTHSGMFSCRSLGTEAVSPADCLFSE